MCLAYALVTILFNILDNKLNYWHDFLPIFLGKIRQVTMGSLISCQSMHYTCILIEWLKVITNGHKTKDYSMIQIWVSFRIIQSRKIVDKK
jgi:hypothetical protein